MWAFGVLFFYMLNAAYPFEIHPAWKIENKYAEMVKQAKDFSYRKVVQKSIKKKMENCTNQIEDLFKKIFNLDIDYRITFAEIRKHPVFAKHFPFVSEQSMLNYKKKYVSKILLKSNKKGGGGGESTKKKEQDKLDVLPSICEVDESKNYPKEKEIVCLQLQEVNFLITIVNDLESVEKHMNPLHTLMFAYNVVKYHIILYRKFLSKLAPAIYAQKHKGYAWQAYFQSEEFKSDKRGYERELKKTELLFEELSDKCRKMMKQIEQQNDSFALAFNKNQSITETEFEGDFFRSYRRSTDILYTSIKEYLKTNKILKLYYFLCIVCICHVFNDFVEDPDLKTEIFSSYLEQETQKGPVFSYQRFIYSLQTSGKEGYVKLAKRIIEECMSR